jgi:hypothetical protein
MLPAVNAKPALTKVRREMNRAPVGVILPIVGSAADVARTSSRSFDKEPARRAKGSFRALLSQPRRPQRQRTIGSLEP